MKPALPMQAWFRASSAPTALVRSPGNGASEKSTPRKRTPVAPCTRSPQAAASRASAATPAMKFWSLSSKSASGAWKAASATGASSSATAEAGVAACSAAGKYGVPGRTSAIAAKRKLHWPRSSIVAISRMSCPTRSMAPRWMPWREPTMVLVNTLLVDASASTTQFSIEGESAASRNCGPGTHSQMSPRSRSSALSVGTRACAPGA